MSRKTGHVRQIGSNSKPTYKVTEHLSCQSNTLAPLVENYSFIGLSQLQNPFVFKITTNCMGKIGTHENLQTMSMLPIWPTWAAPILQNWVVTSTDGIQMTCHRKSNVYQPLLGACVQVLLLEDQSDNWKIKGLQCTSYQFHILHLRPPQYQRKSNCVKPPCDWSECFHCFIVNRKTRIVVNFQNYLTP